VSRQRRRSTAPPTVRIKVVDPNAGSATPTWRRRGALVVLQGQESDIGRHVWVDEKAITIGRDPMIEMPLQDSQISREHCRVGRDAGEYYVEDLSSRNGTTVNGAKLTGRAALNAGDRIFLGVCVLKFTVSVEEVAFHQQMDALVGRDDLTGLVSRLRFGAAFERALQAAQRMKMPLSVLMLDMDGLKQINDAHGHPVGAYTIAEVGKIIGEIVMPHGAACRLGGDEFAAFLSGLPKNVAVDFAESIRSWVARHRFESSGVLVKPTISIGVAAYPTDGKSVTQLLKKADEALFRAKRAGRDRVTT
jgi:two-component system cell cycle response regulator